MKPILLEIEGFNSFESKQIIDFEKLTSLGLFGIFGKTGSGKTTILDSIIYALYADIPRGSNNIINVDCKKASVRYIFSMKGDNGGLFEIQRSVSKSKNEDETILSKSDSSKKARLVKIQDDRHIVLADTKKDVDKKIMEIIGLSYSDFIKTVVLPQGEFSNFLKEKNKDRKEMLERLFSLQKYGDELTEKIKTYKNHYEDIQKDYEKELSNYENIDENSIRLLNEDFEKIQDKILNLEKEYQYLNTLQKEIELLEKYEKIYNESETKLNDTLKWNKKIEDIRQKCQKLEQLSPLQEIIKSYKNLSISLPQEKSQLEILNKNIENLSLNKNTLIEEKNNIDEKIQQIPYLKQEIEDIKSAIQIKSNIKKLNSQKDDLIKMLDELQIKRQDIQEKLNNSQIELKEIRKKISSYEKLILDNTYETSYKEAVRNLCKDIDNLKQNNEEIKALEIEVKNYNSEISQKMEFIKKDEISEKIFLDEIEQLKSDDEKEIYTIEIYEKNEEIEKNLQNIKDIIISNSNEININNSKIQKNQEDIKTLEINLNSKEKLKLNIQENIQTIKNHNLVSHIRSSLHNGDTCPVCNGKYYIDTNEPKQNITDEKKLTENLEILINEISNIMSKIAVLKNENENCINQNKVLKNQIYELSQDVTLEKIQLQIDECIEYRKKYKNYIKISEKKNIALKEKETLLNKVQKKLDIYKVELQNTQKLIITSKDKLAKKQEQSSNLTLEITNLSKQTEISSENAKSKLESIIQSEKLIEQKSKLLNKYKKETELKEETIQKLQNQSESLNKEITNYKISIEKINSSLQVQISSIKDKNFIEIDNLQENLIQKQLYISDIQETAKQNLDNIESINNLIQELQLQITSLKTKIELNTNTLKEHTDQLEKFRLNQNYDHLEEIFKLNDEYPKLLEKKKSVNTYDAQLKEQIAIKNSAYIQYTSQKNKLLQIQGDKKYTKQYHMDIKNSLDESRKKCGYLENKLENEKKIFEKKKDIIIKNKEITNILDEVSQIDKLFKAKAFIQFLSKYQLGYVCQKASEILKNISSGRFELSIDEDSQFMVSDYYNGGIRRLPSTLSGGETFLVSLSLALSLSSQIQLKGNAPLEFFFMDEGFGTLDSNTLDIALECLKKLKNENLSIGIISHVEKIKEFVPIKLEIFQDEKTNSSKVKIIKG